MAIDIHQATPRAQQHGGGIIYEFWLDSVADIADLPKPGEWAANTSIAFVKSTSQVAVLGNNGWEFI